MQLVLLKVSLTILFYDRVKAKVRYVKVIPNEECVLKHTLLVIDIPFNTKKDGIEFEPRVHV